MDTKPRVLLIEDESSIADAVMYAFNRDGFSITHATTGFQGIELFREAPPSLVVLDIGLPDISGFEVCKILRAESNVAILFLTARAEEVDRVLGLEIGGDDYLTKPFSPRELVARARAILRRTREQALPASLQGSNPFHVDSERMRISCNGSVLPLSRYEYRLLCVLLRRPGRVFSREELMNLAWESPEMSLERTVDTHIKTLRTKIRVVDGGADWIVTHRGVGYSLRESL
jgi:two-component system catabolic regulation response regulator CreB